MHTILITGFEPFDGAMVNPSMEAVERLAEMTVPGVRLKAAILPTRYAGAIPALRRAIADCSPGVVIAVGQAGGRAALAIERVAINVDDGRIADNDGIRRIDEPVIQGGPTAYFATLPIKRIVGAIRDRGIPAYVSQSAGTFLCNHVFYAACHVAATERPEMLAGFVHVPYLPSQTIAEAAVASMDLASIVQGLRIAIETVRDSAGADLRVAEGATH